jgi:hypothetical protein
MAAKRLALPKTYSFNLTEWNKTLSDVELREEEFLERTIASPIDIVAIERIRGRAFPESLAKAPADAFVFSLGEPRRRAVTKVGGLPYRPRAKPWPRGPGNDPMTFLAQFRFLESRDILPELPDDVLVVFVRDDNMYDSEGYFHFEWYPLGLRNLVRPADVPPRQWQAAACWGHRHRTVDYLDLDQGFECLADIYSEVKYLAQTGRISRLSGLKIGGLPSWENLDDPNTEHFATRQLLCSAGGLIPWPFTPFPWVNDPKPRTDLHTEEWLYAYDGFGMYFFLTPSGEVEGYCQVNG